jgi:PKD repeat protein
LFYVDLAGGTIRRVTYTATTNRQPVASFSADKTSGAAPLTVAFDASGSSDPDGDTLTYTWDLDGNGTFGDATGAKVSRTYTADGTYTVTLRVTDGRGGSQTTSKTITVGNSPPVPTITSPAAGTQWKVGDPISFSGSATDAQDGTLAPASLSWQVNLHHCLGAGATDCHVHPQQSSTGAGGSYTGPDHEHPAYLELVLTATDSGGLSATVRRRLDPRTVTITMASSPGGMMLGLNSETLPTSFTRTVIQGSSNTIQAPLTQQRGGKTLHFKSWSDGGQAVHTVRPQANATYSASYKQR